MRKSLITIIAIFVLCSTLQAEQKPTCAVFTFQTGGGMNAGQIGRIGNKYAVLLSKTGLFDVIPRYQMNRDLLQNRFDFSSYDTDLDTAIAAGKILGLDYSVLCSFKKTDDQFWLTTSLIDVHSGKIHKTVKSYYKGDVENFIKLAPKSNMNNLLGARPDERPDATTTGPSPAEIEAAKRAKIQEAKQAKAQAAKEELQRAQAEARLVEQQNAVKLAQERERNRLEEEAKALAIAEAEAKARADAQADMQNLAKSRALAKERAEKEAKALAEAEAEAEKAAKSRAAREEKARLKAEAETKTRAKELADVGKSLEPTTEKPTPNDNDTKVWPEDLTDIPFDKHKRKPAQLPKPPEKDDKEIEEELVKWANTDDKEMESIPGIEGLSKEDIDAEPEASWVKWAEQADQELGDLPKTEAKPQHKPEKKKVPEQDVKAKKMKPVISKSPEKRSLVRTVKRKQRKDGISSYIDRRLQIGTRTTFFMLGSDANAKFTGSVNKLEAVQDFVPSKVYASWCFTPKWSTELTWDSIRASANTGSGNADGEFVASGPIVSLLGHYPTSGTWKPYGGVGVAFYTVDFEGEKWWELGYLSEENWKELGSSSGSNAGATQDMLLDNTLGLVLSLGCKKQLSEKWSADFLFRYTNIEINNYHLIYMNGRLVDVRGEERLPLTNYGFGLGLCYSF